MLLDDSFLLVTTVLLDCVEQLNAHCMVMKTYRSGLQMIFNKDANICVDFLHKTDTI